MAIGVDTSKWKPRKITGTPAAKFRNRLAAGILGFGILWGAFFQLSSFTEPMKKAAEVLYEDPIEEVERKILIASGLPVRSGDQIRKLMEEEQRLDLPINKYKVVSKYFASKTVMDESLTEFKEKKSFKVTKIPPPAKPKAKKVKRIKGQKDIRTVLKKNELVAYTEDFDSICKKSGIDVDAEQLQLAIALSKSLQTSETDEGSSSSSKSLTTQQRTGLIRTTLKEYGFKVPEKPTTNRKTKKRRKPYKLLLTSEEEKQQIITDRYSQVLFELNNVITTSSNSDLVTSNLFIYNMSTNIDYEHIKDDSVFYVEDLIEETPNNMGCLLKNWSDIPGRPSSPERDKSELLFSEIECSQDELDIVLSRPLKYSKDIVSKNIMKDREKTGNSSTVKRNINKTLAKYSPDPIEDVEIHSSPVLTTVSSGENVSEQYKESCTIVIVEEKKQLLEIKLPSRSLSPDLFDDEDDTVVEIPNETMHESAIKPTTNVTKEVSEVMDLTECVNTVSQKNSDYSRCMKPSQLSQPNVTKRKSNDMMEMTECVANSSQHMLERVDEHIDLTENCDLGTEYGSTYVENVDVLKSVDSVSQPLPKIIDEHIDLTANCVETESLKSCEGVEITGTTGAFLEDKTVKTKEHIDLTGNYVKDVEQKNNTTEADNIDHMDLTQSSNSSGDSLPFVHIGGTQAVSEESLDETILLNENDYIQKSPDVIMAIDDANNDPQNQSVNSNKNTEDRHISTTYADPVINIDDTIDGPKVNDDNVDLTQTSNSNEAPDTVYNNSSLHINNSNLGKKDDVSVDYDEALENMNSFPYYSHDDNYHSDTRLTEDNLEKTNNNDLLSSSRQEVLELSDNENSPNKHKNVENHFDFGGISVIDNLPSFRKSRNTMGSINNGSMRDSLPMVNVKGTSVEKQKSPLTNLTNENPSNDEPQTPQLKVNRQLNVETPEQSEYIVKTVNVTPMLDYASMSSPERNRELDKYGLKPFKRKRAIQLLTHLYNQTHPYVESTEELTSPSKKRKTENISQPSSSKSSSTEYIRSPRKVSKSPSKLSQSPGNLSKSPRKTSQSPRKSQSDLEKLNDTDKEYELFLVTREVPVIRNVECDADDWVFQKREKAKLHSCRVPLHIAFHNYVSCRRRLHEAILRYEPVNIDVIHKQLAASGHRYDPKELLKFLDKKCITVKTADNTKNNKR